MALNFKKGGDVKNQSAQIAAGGVADADAGAVGGAEGQVRPWADLLMRT